ncbi:MAG: YIP1 family protein [Haloarculaceae archaeon]
MTTWVENPTGGRDRGPRGLARAWVEVLVRPRRFFTNGVAPGDQAPGLVFAVAVTLVYLGSRFALDPASVPTFGGRPYVSALLVLAAAGLIIAPAALHLTAALQTILLMISVRDRAGVSETVQVLAYATAPCALAGLPIPGLRVACAAYGFVLLIVGMSVVHDVSIARAALVVAVPGVVVFGYAFGGLFALETVTGLELVNTDPPVASAILSDRSP